MAHAGAGLNQVSHVPAAATQVLGQGLACFLLPPLQPPPLGNPPGLRVPRHNVYCWSGDLSTRMPQHLQANIPAEALPCSGTSAHPRWLPGPQTPEWVPWTRGAAGEPGSGRCQGNFGVNGETSPPALGRKRRVTVGEGGRFLPADRRDGGGGHPGPVREASRDLPGTGGLAWGTAGQGRPALGGACGPETSFAGWAEVGAWRSCCLGAGSHPCYAVNFIQGTHIPLPGPKASDPGWSTHPQLWPCHVPATHLDSVGLCMSARGCR